MDSSYRLTKNQKIVKYIIYCAILAISSLIQNTAGLTIEIGGARCFILIPVVIIISVSEDEKTAAFLGLFAGMLWDINSPVHMGFNCIYLMLMCYLFSATITYFARDTFITNMIFAFIAISIYCFLYWLFFIIIKGVDSAEDTLITFYIPCAIYTMILSPLFWLILKPIKKKLTFSKI